MKKDGVLLIVDDEPDLRDVLVEHLSGVASRCITAKSGKEALNLLLSEKPDAILSDITMPSMNGLELLAELRKQDIPTPFIFLTGYSDKEKVTQALRMGALDFHEKPFDRHRLLESVKIALEIGVQLRNLEADLDEFVRQAGVAPQDEPKYRAIKRRLLITQTKNHNILKRSP